MHFLSFRPSPLPPALARTNLHIYDRRIGLDEDLDRTSHLTYKEVRVPRLNSLPEPSWGDLTRIWVGFAQGVVSFLTSAGYSILPDPPKESGYNLSKITFERLTPQSPEKLSAEYLIALAITTDGLW